MQAGTTKNHRHSHVASCLCVLGDLCAPRDERRGASHWRSVAERRVVVSSSRRERPKAPPEGGVWAAVDESGDLESSKSTRPPTPRRCRDVSAWAPRSRRTR